MIAKTSIKCAGLRFGGVSAKFLERARQGKFPEPVTHHVFRDKHGVENLAVMNVERQADKIGRDHRTARPRLDWRLGLGILRLLDFILEVKVNKRTFFNRASHGSNITWF